MRSGPTAPSIAQRAARLLDPESLAEALRRSGIAACTATIGYRRLRDDGGVVICFDAHGFLADGEPVVSPGYVRMFARAERQREVQAKWQRLRPRETPLGPGLCSLADGDGLVFLFPNDLRLRALFEVTIPDKVKRRLGELPDIAGDGWRVRGKKLLMETVRYKPEHRYVARLALSLRHDRDRMTDSRIVFLRQFADRRAQRIDRIARTLRDACGLRWLPRPLGTILDATTYVEEAVAGGPWIENQHETTRELAQRLAALHGSAAHVCAALAPDEAAEAGDGFEATGLLEHALARAMRRIDDMTAIGALDAAEAIRLADDLACYAPPRDTTALVHGDLHLEQVLVTADGPTLVDLERCGPGDALEDLGNLVAHARTPGALEQPEAFTGELIEAYRRRSPPRPARDLAFFEAVAHIERAALPVRRLEPDAASSARVSLELAKQAIDSARGPAIAVREVRGVPPAAEPRSPRIVRVARGALAGRGLSLDALVPSRRSLWALAARDGRGLRVFGTIEPRTGELRVAGRDDAVRDDEISCDPSDVARGEIVAYRPGRRAVVRTGDPADPLWLKIVRPKRAGAMLEAHRALRRLAPPAPRVPRLLAHDVARGRFLFANLEGSSLHDEGPLEGNSAALDSVAQAIASLQTATLPASLAQGAGGAALGDLQHWCSVAKDHLLDTDGGSDGGADGGPDGGAALASQIGRTLAEVSDAMARTQDAAAPGVITHGDLHDKNVIVTPDARGVGLLDLEGLCADEPARDVANLAAHFVVRSLQRKGDAQPGRDAAVAFLEAWQKHGGRAAQARLLAFESLTLLRLGCVYLFRPHGLSLVPSLIEEAARLAAETR